MLSLSLPSVKESLALGLDVCLPDILDEFLLLTVEHFISVDSAIALMSYQISNAHDVSATQGDEIARFTLKKLGVVL